MNFPKETLAGMYGTDIPFLESVKAPVLGRKFNYIAALTMDPPRVLTDGINAYTRNRSSEQGVLCDFDKTMTGGAINQLYEDGDMNDIVRGVNADYEFNQETLNAKFRPSDVYQFMRADAERYTDEVIKDFFQAKYEDKEEQKRDFMADYGVSPADAEMILRKQRVEVAEAALKEFNAGRLPMRPKGTRVGRADLIAKNFMRNDVPMIEETTFFSPDGNFVPGVTGLSLPMESTRVRVGRGSRRVPVRVAAEETLRDAAIDGLPIIPLSEAERQEKMTRKLELKRKQELFEISRQDKASKKASAAAFEVMSETRLAAQFREEALGRKGKRAVIKEFMELRPDIKTKASAERILASVADAKDMRKGAGRPMEPQSTSLALVKRREAATMARKSAEEV